MLNPVIITSRASGRWDVDRLPVALAAVTTLTGVAMAWWYFHAGLTLSHYDAKAHLVVARRIIDSLTPGWQQIGAVWLPLPHLLNVIPVQIDELYRTGLSAVALSVASFALAAYSVARLIVRATGSKVGAIAGCVSFILNPNLLYLQATPMTEPLLIGLLLLSTLLVYEWASSGAGMSPRAAGGAMALACLTRYEAWPACAALLGTSLCVFLRRGDATRVALSAIASLAAYPGAAVLGFLVLSRMTVGEWFVTSGFFVPDSRVAGRPVLSLIQVWWGAHQLSGYGLMTFALLSVAVILWRALREPEGVPLAIVLAPLASMLLPWYAFLQGHPFRIRYMVPVVAAGALCSGVAVGLSRWRNAGAAMLLALTVLELNPIDQRAPMVLEAQWDRPYGRGRQDVTRCLQSRYKGETIMVSMGSLAHYLQELSAAGFALRDFVHEGNGDLWRSTLDDPRSIAGWILVEERAEGGDMLAAMGRSRPQFFEGFVRTCEGGGVALYQRLAAP